MANKATNKANNKAKSKTQTQSQTVNEIQGEKKTRGRPRVVQKPKINILASSNENASANNNQSIIETFNKRKRGDLEEDELVADLSDEASEQDDANGDPDYVYSESSHASVYTPVDLRSIKEKTSAAKKKRVSLSNNDQIEAATSKYFKQFQNNPAVQEEISMLREQVQNIQEAVLNLTQSLNNQTSGTLPSLTQHQAASQSHSSSSSSSFNSIFAHPSQNSNMSTLLPALSWVQHTSNPNPNKPDLNLRITDQRNLSSSNGSLLVLNEPRMDPPISSQLNASHRNLIHARLNQPNTSQLMLSQHNISNSNSNQHSMPPPISSQLYASQHKMDHAHLNQPSMPPQISSQRNYSNANLNQSIAQHSQRYIDNNFNNYSAIRTRNSLLNETENFFEPPASASTPIPDHASRSRSQMRSPLAAVNRHEPVRYEQEPPYLRMSARDHAKALINFKNASCSLKNFGVKLLEYYFSLDELIDPNVNVTGKVVKGSDKEMNGLDPERLELIREEICKYVEGGELRKMIVWRDTLKAMNSKLAELKWKYNKTLPLRLNRS